jgi:hypothetical protein
MNPRQHRAFLAPCARAYETVQPQTDQEVRETDLTQGMGGRSLCRVDGVAVARPDDARGS